MMIYKVDLHRPSTEVRRVQKAVCTLEIQGTWLKGEGLELRVSPMGIRIQSPDSLCWKAKVSVLEASE